MEYKPIPRGKEWFQLPNIPNRCLRGFFASGPVHCQVRFEVIERIHTSHHPHGQHAVGEGTDIARSCSGTGISSLAVYRVRRGTLVHFLFTLIQARWLYEHGSRPNNGS